jgi:prephenate dehydrogenase
MIFNHQLPIILIVGAGNIGKWHIQSISTLKFLCRIFIIDNNEKNLLHSKEFFNKNSINIKNVFFFKENSAS